MAVACNQLRAERDSHERGHIPVYAGYLVGLGGHLAIAARGTGARTTTGVAAPLCVSRRCKLNAGDRGRLLRIYPVLRELPPALLKKVEETAKPIQAPGGLRLFGDGSPCASYPLLLEGV